MNVLGILLRKFVEEILSGRFCGVMTSLGLGSSPLGFQFKVPFGEDDFTRDLNDTLGLQFNLPLAPGDILGSTPVTARYSDLMVP